MSDCWQEFYPSYCVADPDLSPARVDLVQGSWAKIDAGTAAGQRGKPEGYFGERFYEILFERYPATKDLFSNPGRQARALSKMLAAAVGLLNKDLDAVVAQLQALAARHHRYGTEPQHYGPVGECLVAALTEALGDDLDAPAADAWVHLYSTICVVMLPVTHQMCSKDKDTSDAQEE